MFVVLTEESPPPVGTELTLRFWLPSSDKLIATTGQVVWLNTPGESLKISHPPGMGVRFTRASGDVRQFIKYFVAQHYEKKKPTVD